MRARSAFDECAGAKFIAVRGAVSGPVLGEARAPHELLKAGVLSEGFELACPCATSDDGDDAVGCQAIEGALEQLIGVVECAEHDEEFDKAIPLGEAELRFGDLMRGAP